MGKEDLNAESAIDAAKEIMREKTGGKGAPETPGDEPPVSNEEKRLIEESLHGKPFTGEDRNKAVTEAERTLEKIRKEKGEDAIKEAESILVKTLKDYFFTEEEKMELRKEAGELELNIKDLNGEMIADYKKAAEPDPDKFRKLIEHRSGLAKIKYLLDNKDPDSKYGHLMFEEALEGGWEALIKYCFSTIQYNVQEAETELEENYMQKSEKSEEYMLEIGMMNQMIGAILIKLKESPHKN